MEDSIIVGYLFEFSITLSLSVSDSFDALDLISKLSTNLETDHSGDVSAFLSL